MEEDDLISKTQRKRQMQELQDVGAELVKLSPEQLAHLDLPENLREAVLACKGFTKHEAIRRQVQYIGRIMRDLEVGPIAEKLAVLRAPSRRQKALLHVAERWRTELIDDPASVARFVHEFPDADAQRLRELVDLARDEKRAALPPKRFRELFHVLNAVLQDHGRRNP